MEPNFTYYAAFKEASQPTIPSSGLVLFYAKNDKKLYYINSDGVEIAVSGGAGSTGGGGASAYIVYSPTTTMTLTEASGEVVVLANATSAGITVNLPTAISNTAKIDIKKIDSSVNTVIIDPSGSQTVDGSATKTIEFQNTSVSLVSNGSNWFIV